MKENSEIHSFKIEDQVKLLTHKLNRHIFVFEIAQASTHIIYDETNSLIALQNNTSFQYGSSNTSQIPFNCYQLTQTEQHYMIMKIYRKEVKLYNHIVFQIQLIDFSGHM